MDPEIQTRLLDFERVSMDVNVNEKVSHMAVNFCATLTVKNYDFLLRAFWKRYDSHSC